MELITIKKIVTILLIILLALVCVEITGLIWLRTSIGRYETFWERKAGEPGEYTYVALGDSAAQGLGASSPMNGYVGQITTRIENKQNQTVKVVNVSRSGARIRDVLDRQLRELESLEAPPDLVTIEIGANDVAGFNEQIFTDEFSELVKRLPAGTYISDIPDFGGGPRLGSQRKAAEIARRIIKTREDLNFVPLESHTQQFFNHSKHYSFDFFHPNNRGYAIWADAFVETIEK